MSKSRIDLTKVSYTHLSTDEIFFRGTARSDSQSEENRPFSQGIYVSNDAYVGCVYSDHKDQNLQQFKLVHSTIVFNVTWKNIHILLHTLKHMRDPLVLRNGVQLQASEAATIITNYCSFTPNVHQPLVIDTGSGKYITLKDVTNYQGHWFAHIICFFGFQGYRVGMWYKRKENDYMFHPEFYFCYPRVQLKATRAVSNVCIPPPPPVVT